MNDKDHKSLQPDERMNDAKAAQSLEHFIRTELSQLSDLTAPPTLIPRVLAAIQARQNTGWWRRSWFDWPASWQMASLALLASLPVFAFWGSDSISTYWQPVPVTESVTTGFNLLRALGHVARGLGSAVLVILRSLDHPWVLGCATLIATMYLACIGLGTACVRVASGKSSFGIKFK